MLAHLTRPTRLDGEHHLLGLSSLIAVMCLVFIWKNPGSQTESIPEVIIPLGISLGLGLYTLRIRDRDASAHEFQPMAKYAWAGALASCALGGFWFALHVHYGLPIDVLPDKILTIASLGIATGVLIGRSPSLIPSYSPAFDRSDVLVETAWTGRPGSTPIANAIVDALAQVEEVDTLELDPLYAHVDPEILASIREHDGSPWQFIVYIDAYEVRISSHGTITVYANGH